MSRAPIYPFAQLAIGEEFSIPLAIADQQSLMNAARAWARRHNPGFRAMTLKLGQIVVFMRLPDNVSAEARRRIRQARKGQWLDRQSSKRPLAHRESNYLERALAHV